MNNLTSVTIVLFTTIAFLFSACKKDENSAPAITITITTLATQNMAGVAVDLGANLTTSDLSDIIRVGVCWSTAVSPTIAAANYQETYPSYSGDYSFTITDKFSPLTTYYVRSYYEDSKGITYGNTISFTTEAIVVTTAPTEIFTTKATVNGFINQPSNSYADPGFCWSAVPHPTVNNFGTTVYTYGTSNYNYTITNLQPNTTYYVRSFIEVNGVYYYGDEKAFTTCGYWGPSGGYVAYDKGVNSNGWRYLEVWHTTLSYNISWSTGSSWGDYNTFISGTGDQLDDGPSNTNKIVNKTTAADCAAKLCDNFTGGGNNDWYLPSSNEMLLIANSMHAANSSLIIGTYTWTSTQIDTQYAWATVFDSNTNSYKLFNSYPKNFDNLNVFPVRRY